MLVPPPPPPTVIDLPRGTPLVAGLGYSMVLPDMDFETYSEAGYVWDADKNEYRSPVSKKKPGLSLVGLQVYAEHPSTEVLSLAYNLKDGRGRHVWFPGVPLPLDLFSWLAVGGLMEAWNITFEERIWNEVCVKKYGFPVLPVSQLRCAMAKSRAHCLPGGLANAGTALKLPVELLKLNTGKDIVTRYCMPRKPTKADPRHRIHPLGDNRGGELYQYNLRDIDAEAHIAARIPELSEQELRYWQVDQACNRRGVAIDLETIDAMIELLDHIYASVNREVQAITGGTVSAITEVERLLGFLAGRGVYLDSLDEEAVGSALNDVNRGLPDDCYRLLALRQATAAASVKKVYTMKRMASKTGRLHDLFIYHSARTGRDAGADAQPQNLTNGGPDVCLCSPCGQYVKPAAYCRNCGALGVLKKAEWNATAAEQAIPLIRARDHEELDLRYGSAVAAMSGCMRALFIADEGHDFIATDFVAIEAVVAAALAGEQWRLDTFAAKEDIYLASVSRIMGTPVETYKQHREATNMHHPHRKIGKVAELASGFGGWTGAWKAFGAEEALGSEEAIKDAILGWRAASPTIVEMWGGQFRGLPWKPDYRPELYGLEGCAIQAIQHPGVPFAYRGITYRVARDVLYCTLLSGRSIAYHEPRLVPDAVREGNLKIVFMGWNTNPKAGPLGWVQMSTYGGKLFENVVQATARDIFINAAINAEQAAYWVILRVHDELVTQRPHGVGSVEELEAICGRLPAWAAGWPVRAAGGWRGKRYRKD